MNIVETIISILDEKGPLSIPLICQEVNELLITDRGNPILPSQIKSIVSRKKDIFRVKAGNISFVPDKYPYSLIATVEGDEGITYQLNVSFEKNRFSFFEWRDKRNRNSNPGPQHRKLGSMDEFKRKIIEMEIWDWKLYYGTGEGITLGKTNWTVRLKTRNKTYLCEGIDCYPENWAEFCQSIEKFAGVPFTM